MLIHLPTLIVSPGAAPLSALDGLLHPQPLLAMNSFTNEQVIGIIALVGGLLLAAFIVTLVLYFQNRKRQLWHETARLALEKGQPLPSEPPTDEELAHRPPPGANYAEWERTRLVRERRNDIKSGLILIAVGGGLYLMLGAAGIFAGAIPGFIGVALLVNGLIERFSSRDSSAPRDGSPRA